MTDTTNATGTAPVPQANPNGLMHIGAVAAYNIVAALDLPAAHVGTVEQAIKDEINAMSSHFTLAIADVQTQYEAEVLKLTREKDDFITATKARETQAVAAFQKAVADIKSDFNWVENNQGKVAVVSTALIAVGLVLGALIGHVL